MADEPVLQRLYPRDDEKRSQAYRAEIVRLRGLCERFARAVRQGGPYIPSFIRTEADEYLEGKL